MLIGSIVINGKEIYIKIIGKFSSSEELNPVVLKVTRTVAESLGVRDKYFRVIMSYPLHSHDN